MEDDLFADLKERRQAAANRNDATPSSSGRPMYLLSVSWEEDYVQAMCARAVDIFQRNVAGPTRYLRLYDSYKQLLNGDADKERDRFLGVGRATLADFQARMDGYSGLKRDIKAIRNKAMLNLFVLDCTELNKSMADHCQQLYDSLIKHQVSIL